MLRVAVLKAAVLRAMAVVAMAALTVCSGPSRAKAVVRAADH